jgi:hypothetical protein
MSAGTDQPWGDELRSVGSALLELSPRAIAELLSYWAAQRGATLLGRNGEVSPARVGAVLGVERGAIAGIHDGVPNFEAVDMAEEFVRWARGRAAERRPMTIEQQTLLGEYAALSLLAGVSMQQVNELLDQVCGNWG